MLPHYYASSLSLPNNFPFFFFSLFSFFLPFYDSFVLSSYFSLSSSKRQILYIPQCVSCTFGDTKSQSLTQNIACFKMSNLRTVSPKNSDMTHISFDILNGLVQTNNEMYSQLLYAVFCVTKPKPAGIDIACTNRTQTGAHIQNILQNYTLGLINTPYIHSVQLLAFHTVQYTNPGNTRK